MVTLNEVVIRVLDEGTLETIRSAQSMAGESYDSPNCRAIEAELCSRLLSRYEKIERARAMLCNLTKDCVRQMRDADGNTWNFHLRTGYAWSAMP